MKTLAAIRESDEPFLGEKAKELSRLVRAGFPVPESAVLDSRDLARFTRGVPPPDLAALISRCAAALRARGYANLVIRTSPRGSAGAAPAALNLPAGDFGAILAAIAKATAPDTALLIQAMIPGELTGSLTSLDVEGGNETTHLIALTGTSDRIAYDWRAEGTVGAAKFHRISAVQVKALSKLALEIQRTLGVPLTLEWAIHGEKIFVLGTRPVANLLKVDSTWTMLDPRRKGAVFPARSPLFVSQTRAALARALPESFTQIRLLPATGTEWTKTVAGRLSWNVAAAKTLLARLPGFSEREFDEALGTKIAYSGPGVTTTPTPLNFFGSLRKLAAAKRILRERPARIEAARKRIDAASAAFTPDFLRSATDASLADAASSFLGDWSALERETFLKGFDAWTTRILASRKKAKPAPALKPADGLRDAEVRASELAKKIFLELGRRCVVRKTLPKAEDLLLLDPADAVTFFRGENAVKDQANLEVNRALHEAYRNFREPVVANRIILPLR